MGRGLEGKIVHNLVSIAGFGLVASILELAAELGFDPEELRQAMAAKRSAVRMLRLKSRFYDGMAANGITGPDADHLFDALSAFASTNGVMPSSVTPTSSLPIS